MRLIDADALIGALHNHAFLEGDDRSICYNIIQKQPTVDAVPVVRCKDCKHYFPEGHVRCWNIRGMHYPVEPDEFCSRAERKEE